MRPLLVCVTALAALIALGAALWLGRPSRSGAQLERGVEPAAAQARPAAELAAGGAPEEAQQRMAVEVVAAPAQTKPAAALSAPELQASAHKGASMAELTVFVVADEDEAPLAGVLLFSEAWPQRDDGETDGGETTSRGESSDELGRATFSLPAGGRRVFAWTQRDRELIVELAAGERLTAALRLRSRADLDFELRTLDAASGKPLAGARVDVTGFNFPDAVVGATETALSDDLGRATLRLPSWMALMAEVSSAGYGPAVVSLEGAHTDRDHALDVLLAQGARLEGLILDGGGLPAKDARVTVKVGKWALKPENPNQVLGDFMLGDKEWECTTLADGRYALENLATGVDCSLELEYDGRRVLEEEGTLRLAPGEVRVRDFRVGTVGTITGVLLNAAGEPVARQRLVLVRGSEERMLRSYEEPFARTFTGLHGSFSFRRVPPGSWLIGPAAVEDPSPQALLPLAQVVELPPGVPKVEVKLTLPAGLSVAGRCIGPDGAPLAGAKMTAFGGGASASAASAEDGGFLLGPLPAGEVSLQAAEHDGCVAEDVRAQAGDSNIVMRFGTAARIQGTVVDAVNGAGLPAELLISSSGATRWNGYMITGTNPSGAFDVSGLCAGRRVFVARTPSGLVSPPRAVEVAAGETATLELRVAPGGKARLLLPEGEHWIMIRAAGDLADDHYAGAAEEREWTTHPFRPGAFTVELRDREGALLAAREATAAAGEVVEVDLR